MTKVEVDYDAASACSLIDTMAMGPPFCNSQKGFLVGSTGVE